MSKSVALFATCALAISLSAWGGGSEAPVSVQSLQVSGVEYTLVVAPASEAQDDPYMGKCDLFTVRGTYDRLEGAYLHQPSLLSKEAHLKALAYLQSAYVAHRRIRLGWMGTGFVPVHADEPCVVKSRALVLLDDQDGTAVISFHNAI